jgi:hypothetical protein
MRFIGTPASASLLINSYALATTPRVWLRITLTCSFKEVRGRTNCLLPLIRHGPHRKRRVQQFFYCCVCIRGRDEVFIEGLPSNECCLTVIAGGIHTQAHRQQGDKPTFIFSLLS